LQEPAWFTAGTIDSEGPDRCARGRVHRRSSSPFGRAQQADVNPARGNQTVTSCYQRPYESIPTLPPSLPTRTPPRLFDGLLPIALTRWVSRVRRFEPCCRINHTAWSRLLLAILILPLPTIDARSRRIFVDWSAVSPRRTLCPGVLAVVTANQLRRAPTGSHLCFSPWTLVQVPLVLLRAVSAARRVFVSITRRRRRSWCRSALRRRRRGYTGKSSAESPRFGLQMLSMHSG